MDGTSTAGRGRRRESLAARQARVGIVANPRQIVLPRPTPREVWTRWPVLRSSKRRSHMPDSSVQGGPDLSALDEYARSLRQSGGAPAMTHEETPNSVAIEGAGAPERSGLWRLLDRLAFGAALKKRHRTARSSSLARAALAGTAWNSVSGALPVKTSGPVPAKGQDQANAPSPPQKARLFLTRLAILATALIVIFHILHVFWGIP